jgi:hypothetical protein
MTSSAMVELDEIGFTGGNGVGEGFGLARAAQWTSYRWGASLRLCATGLEKETAEFRPARVQSEAVRRVLRSGRSPVVRYHGLGPGNWFWRSGGLSVLRLCAWQCEQAWPVEFGWTSERAGLRLRQRESNASRCRFYPSRFAMGAVLTAAAKPGGAPEGEGDSQLAASSTSWPTSC